MHNPRIDAPTQLRLQAEKENFQNFKKKECIPVGCVPTTSVVVTGGGALPPEVGLPPGEVGTLPPHPREQNDWQIPLKTLHRDTKWSYISHKICEMQEVIVSPNEGIVVVVVPKER